MTNNIIFRLIGRTTTFYGHTFTNRVGIPCIFGITRNKQHQTTARLADVVIIGKVEA